MAKKQNAVKEETKVESQPASDSLISRIYLITKTGPEMLEGVDAEVDIKAIQEAAKNSEDGDTPYTFYENGRVPVYVAIKDGSLTPLVFPEPGAEPGQAGMTSMELYAKAVTLPSTIEKIIELETQPKPSLIDEAKRIMTPTIAIIACVLVIFLILVTMKG